MTELFDTLGRQPSLSTLRNILFLLSQVIPIMVKIPTERTKLIRKLNATMGTISSDLLTRSRREKDVKASEIEEGKSIMGLLSTIAKTITESLLIDTVMTVKAEDQDRELHLSGEEIMAQVRGCYIPLVCKLTASR